LNEFAQLTTSDFNNNVNTGTVITDGNQISLSTSSAGWYNTSWTKRRPITITHSGSALSDYQMKMTISYFADMRSDFGDLRFTSSDGATPLDYWIETYSSGSSATVWVKVDAIPNGSSDIFMYYGNASASTSSNMETTFSHIEPEIVGYVVSDRLASSGLRVISLADGNRVCAGTNCINLDDQQTTTFSASVLSIGTAIKARYVIQADANDYDAADAISPISWAGTEFYYLSDRGPNRWCIVSPFGNTTVRIYDNGSQQWSSTVGTSGTCASVDIIDGNTVRISSSSLPILVQHYSTTPYDAMPLYPATNEDLYGIPSSTLDIGSGPSGASVSWVTSDGGSGNSNLGANGNYKSTGLGQFGQSSAYRISSNNPIGANQLGDGDGGEATTFLPESEFGTVFGSANPAGYIAIVTPNSSTTCNVYNSSGSLVGTQTGGSGTVNRLCFNCGNTATWANGGWKMVCNKPVYAYYQNNTPDADETNLLSFRQMRQYVYPEPTYSRRV